MTKQKLNEIDFNNVLNKTFKSALVYLVCFCIYNYDFVGSTKEIEPTSTYTEINNEKLEKLRVDNSNFTKINPWGISMSINYDYTRNNAYISDCYGLTLIPIELNAELQTFVNFFFSFIPDIENQRAGTLFVAGHNKIFLEKVFPEFMGGLQIERGSSINIYGSFAGRKSFHTGWSGESDIIVNYSLQTNRGLLKAKKEVFIKKDSVY